MLSSCETTSTAVAAFESNTAQAGLPVGLPYSTLRAVSFGQRELIVP
jgi:hypothetical protein